jgi:stage IV sporulation protein FB
MRDPLSWSIPIGRLFGVTIRVHLLFPFVAGGLILRAAWQTKPEPVEGAWLDAAVVMALLFLSVVLHEFGHCFGARLVGGDAQDILIWPLGGLANVEVPQNPRANLVTAAAGPFVNLVLCSACGLALYFACNTQPIWNPLEGYHARTSPITAEKTEVVPVSPVSGNHDHVAPYSPTALLTHLFYVNWILLFINIVLIGFPLDGGRIFQSILWFFVGYRQATFAAVIAGVVTTVVVGLYAIVYQEVLALGLTFFIYISCMHQWHVLELGADDSLFGYDFSQGYTSLEREHGPTAAPAPPKQSWWQRWKEQRALKKAQLEQERRESEERRMDELLEKISTRGMAALSDEERRFMKQFSDRYRNKH